MNKFLIILLCFLLNLFGSCQGPKEVPNYNSLIKLTVIRSNTDKSTYSSIFSTIKKINLETNKDCLIGNIHNVKIVNDELYIIHDLSSESSLLRFKIDGHFLNVIGKDYGKGPKEIMNPRDFWVNDSIIEVWSRLNISQFHKNGVFIKKKFNAFIPGVGFFKYKDYYYLYHSATPPYMLTKHKANGSVKAQYLPYNYIDAISYNDKVISYDNTILLFSSVYDTIYSFNNGNVTPKAYFEFVNMTSPMSSLKKSNNISEFLVKLKDNCVITNYFENTNYIFFEFTYDRKIDYCIYNKRENKSIYFNNKIIDDMAGFTFSAPVCLSNDDYLVIPVYYNELLDTRDKHNSQIVDIYDNPILLFCKIKP